MTELIPIAKITFRKHNREEASLEIDGLAESIKIHGLLEPILVTKSKNGWDLIAGERRVRACTKIGEKHIEAKILEADDVQRECLALVENLQRKDLTPWEEAKQVSEWKERQPQARIEDLGAQIGRPAPWVAQRLAMSKLLPSLRELVIKQEWPLGHIVLLARLRPEVQAEMLVEIKSQQTRGYSGWRVWDGNKWTLGPPGLAEFRRHLASYERVLSSSRWRKDDATLVPKAGACNECPKRSSQAGHLFQEPGDDKHDRCLDPKCWQSKEHALIQLSITRVKEQTKAEPLYLGNSHGPKPAGITEVQDHYDFQLTKKTDPKAQAAVIVNGDRAGEVCYVKKGSTSTPAMKPRRTVNQETGKAEGPSTKERLESLKLKRQARAVQIWADAMLKIELPPVTVIRLATIFGTNHRDTSCSYDAKKKWNQYVKIPEVVAEAAAKLAHEVIPVMAQRLVNHGTLQATPQYWAEACQQSEAMDAEEELGKCFAQAVKEIPLPKVLVKEGVKDPDAEPDKPRKKG